MLLKEIELLKNMEPHSNLITMKGCCSVSPDSPIMLIMEYMNMGNLLKYLRKNRCLVKLLIWLPLHRCSMIMLRNVTVKSVKNA